MVSVENNKFKFFTLFGLLSIFLLFLKPFGDVSLPSHEIQFYNDENVLEQERIPNRASNDPNGKPLIVHQYANISNSRTYTNIKSGENVSFTLTQGWISKNTTINYAGVSKKKDWVSNGEFDSDASCWTFKTNDDTQYEDDGYKSTIGNPAGSISIYIASPTKAKGDYGYFEQNISIKEGLSPKIAVFTFDYQILWSNVPDNTSVFMAVKIGNVEKNQSVLITGAVDWANLRIEYDPVAYNQVLPGNVSLRMGIYTNDESNMVSFNYLRFDNVKFELWTKPNQTGLLKAYDNDFVQNNTYYNKTYGEGFSFIDVERTRDPTEEIDFTIYCNISGVLDFSIDEITIISHAVKEFNSTVSNALGSLYTLGENINWLVEFSLFIPADYASWVEISKPIDWSFFNIIDGFEANKTLNCLGRDFGSMRLEIPNSDLGPGLWRLNAISQNYISNGNIAVWDSYNFINTTQLTFGDLFQINVTLGDSVALSNTQINCTIYYPNNSVFWQGYKEPSDVNVKFWNFTVAENTTVGEYFVSIKWTNNLSYLSRDRIGFRELKFVIWHHTNLTAITPYFEKVTGDPLFVKVNFTDRDINDFVGDAKLTFNSTFGVSGMLTYQGLGIYSIDIDTSTLDLGNYYFSFNASKIYFENKTEIDLIHLKIIAQPLELQLPRTVINATANSYVTCQINVTGSISGTLITESVNITTNWNKNFTVTNHYNGSYTLNFSTSDLPAQGTIETFSITVFANKTHYGSTSDIFNIQVYPILTEISVDKSVINAYVNQVFDVKVQYLVKESGAVISGADCSIDWPGNYIVKTSGNGLVISINTEGIALDTYTPLIKLARPGFETKYRTITIVVSKQTVNLTVFLNSKQINENSLTELKFNDKINITVRALSINEDEYLTNCNMTLISENFNRNFTEYEDFWYNTTMKCSPSSFSLGLNYLYVNFQKENYQITTFAFQLMVRQIEIEIIPLNFEDNTDYYVGDEIIIQLKIIDSSTNKTIEDAEVSYSWEFGIGVFEEKNNATFELNLDVPANVRGNYKINAIVFIEGNLYKTKEFSFTIIISERNLPSELIWIIIIILIIALGVFVLLSVRSYIIVPRRRRIESALLEKTQRFKDIENIQAIMVIQKQSGLAIYIKSYSILGGEKQDLFPGFIHAITAISQEFKKEDDFGIVLRDVEDTHIVEKLIELDFKYFYCLIGDMDVVRVVLVLKERSSERLKEKLTEFLKALSLKIGEKLKEWYGDLQVFQEPIMELINEYFELYYKDKFTLNRARFIASIKKKSQLTSMENQVLNEIYKIAKGKKAFLFQDIFNVMYSDNRDLLIEAIELLIARKIIIPKPIDSNK